MHTDSDIFLIDEVLAVGDKPFKKKCLARIGIRWGVMPGSRITLEFRVGDVAALARARRGKA